MLADYRSGEMNGAAATSTRARQSQSATLMSEPSIKFRVSTKAEIIRDAASLVFGGAFSLAIWLCVGAVIWQLAASLWR